MEYDPSRKDQLKHREFLKSVSNFKDVLPIQDDAIKKKITQTYRMQVRQKTIFDEMLSDNYKITQTKKNSLQSIPSDSMGVKIISLFQYVQESVLPAPSMFEQDNLSTLASFVFFSKVDIVKMVLKEPDHIDSCLKSLKDKSTPPRRQVELCGFLKGKKN